MSQLPSNRDTPSPSSSVDELLHRLHDGELPAGERAAIEASLDDEARLKLGALSDLGTLLRSTAAVEDAPLVERFDAWPAIEKQIAAGKVLSFRGRLARHRIPIWVSTLVAAAAVFAVLLSPLGGRRAAPNGCDIEDLVVTGADVTVMKMADGKGEGGGTTVVWVHEIE